MRRIKKKVLIASLAAFTLLYLFGPNLNVIDQVSVENNPGSRSTMDDRKEGTILPWRQRVNKYGAHAPLDDAITLEYGFEPNVKSDFPSVQANYSRIPHIMHQIWITNDDDNTSGIVVPIQFQGNVKSFFKHHDASDWLYYFWGRKSGRGLIKSRYSECLALYDSYDSTVAKSELVRYIALYEYGGVYADLDHTFLRSLDRVTMKYPCILTVEPFEHPVFEQGLPYRISNHLMFCRKGHPFVKLLIDNLARARMFTAAVDNSGSGYITLYYMTYANITGNEIFHAHAHHYRDNVEPFFYKGTKQRGTNDTVYIANSQYFSLPIAKNYKRVCRENESPPALVLRMCAFLEERNFTRHVNRFAFTNHGWSNTKGHSTRFRKTARVDLSHFNTGSEMVRILK